MMTKDVGARTIRHQGNDQPPPFHYEEAATIHDKPPGHMPVDSPAMRPEMSRLRETPAIQLVGPPGVHGGLGYTGRGTGEDPSDPSTHRRPYNPSRGGFARLHDEQGV